MTLLTPNVTIKRRDQQLHAANDLRAIPLSNRLEALKGDRAGEYSIRINKQWRICFKWAEGKASEVEIADYL